MQSTACGLALCSRDGKAKVEYFFAFHRESSASRSARGQTVTHLLVVRPQYNDETGGCAPAPTCVAAIAVSVASVLLLSVSSAGDSPFTFCSGKGTYAFIRATDHTTRRTGVI